MRGLGRHAGRIGSSATFSTTSGRGEPSAPPPSGRLLSAKNMSESMSIGLGGGRREWPCAADVFRPESEYAARKTFSVFGGGEAGAVS